MAEKLRKEDSAWKKQLTQDQYYVTRKKGTEPPITGEYEDTETAGTYKCVCCGQPLFRSETKYHSGSGWPSFYAPVSKEAEIGFKEIRLRFDLDSDANPEQLQSLLKLSERYCVIYQTLRKPAAMTAVCTTKT